MVWHLRVGAHAWCWTHGSGFRKRFRRAEIARFVMRWLCKVLQNGDDAVVELPDEWVARYGVKVGDELRIS